MGERKKQPKKLTSRFWREIARRTRDDQWAFMQRVADAGVIWFCWWDKDHRHKEPHSAGLYVTGLIDGMEMLEWLNSHKRWWIIGKWDDKRYAAPISLTDAGRRALKNKQRYDMEPVTGGMVEPGWQAIPLPNQTMETTHG